MRAATAQIGNEQTEALTLSAVLAWMSEEQRDLAMCLSTIQDLVGSVLFSTGQPLNSDAVRVIQDLDRITQSVEALARGLSSLVASDSAAAQDRDSLSAAIRLQSIADRMPR